MSEIMYDSSYSPEVNDVRRREIEMIQAGNPIKLAMDGGRTEEEQRRWEEFLESGAARGPFVNSGEADWASWKCDGGPHTEAVRSLGRAAIR